MSTPEFRIFPVANDENLDKAPSTETVLCDNSQLTGMLPIFSNVTGTGRRAELIEILGILICWVI